MVLDANLDPGKLSELKTRLDLSIQSQLEEGDLESCPVSHVSGSYGTIEQSHDGWRLLSKSGDELICNKSWRVVRSVSQSEYEIAVFENGRWVHGEVPKQSMHSRPYKAITQFCIDRSLTPFTFLPKYQNYALHIALQLNPTKSDSIEASTIGLDVSSYIFRTSVTEISAENGEIRQIPRGRSLALLPLATGKSPSATALRRIGRYLPTMQVLTAMTMQIAGYFYRSRQYAVVYGGQYADLTRNIFEWCDLNQQDTPKIFHPLLDTSG